MYSGKNCLFPADADILPPSDVWYGSQLLREISKKVRLEARKVEDGITFEQEQAVENPMYIVKLYKPKRQLQLER